MFDKPSPPVRWHDRNPDMARSVKFLCTLPDELQTVLGDCLTQLVRYRVREPQVIIFRGVKSLGQEKIMGLHKSKSRRRDYDHNASLHAAMGHIYVLPDVEQAQLATVMAELMDYVMEYLQIHQDYGLTVSANGLRQLTEQFMRDNRKRKGVQKSLRDLKNTLSFNRAPLILQEDKLLTRYVNGKIRAEDATFY